MKRLLHLPAFAWLALLVAADLLRPSRARFRVTRPLFRRRPGRPSSRRGPAGGAAWAR